MSSCKNSRPLSIHVLQGVFLNVKCVLKNNLVKNGPTSFSPSGALHQTENSAKHAQQLVELVECYISPSLACTCTSFCPHDGPVGCLYAHMSLKIDLGTRACDFPITSWRVPCENIRFWLHLRQRERLILLVTRSGRHTSPAAVVRWLTAFSSVLRERFSGQTSPCLRSKCQVSVVRACILTQRDSNRGTCHMGVFNLPSYELFHKR